MSLARDPRLFERQTPEEPSFLLPLFDGGPLDRLMTRIGLGLQSRQQIIRRILFWSAITWLPLLILSWTGSIAAARPPSVTFLEDFAVHVRFLVALPFLIGSERFVQVGVGDSPRLLLERRMIPPETLSDLGKTEVWIRTLRDSFVAESVILLLAIGFNLSETVLTLPHDIISWRTLSTTGSKLAQGWFMWVSMLTYHFFVLRWFWRYSIWSAFLFRVAKLKPHLQSLHPDRVGGLAFLIPRHLKFAVVALAISSVMSANIAALARYAGQDVEFFTLPLAMYLTIVALVFIAPLSVFTPVLVRGKLEGLHRYGNLATRYTNLFETKWLRSRLNENRDLLGTADIQSLNDLGGSHNQLSEMRFFILSPRHLLGLIILVLTPLIPLVLTKIPLIVLLKSLAKSFI